VNVPPLVGTVFSSGRATWTELSTTLGVEDLWDILEVLRVDRHNAKVLEEKRRREQEMR
jgi:hypothetical protein